MWNINAALTILIWRLTVRLERLNTNGIHTTGETVKRIKFPLQKKKFDISWKIVQCKSLT